MTSVLLCTWPMRFYTMSRKRAILLLLFRCLFYLHSVIGIGNTTFSSLAISVKNATTEKSNNPLKVNNGGRRNYSHWKSRHVVKPVNVGTRSKFTSISAALGANKRPKDTLEDTVIRSAFQTRKLKEELQRRQVSLIVLVSHHRDGAAWNGGITWMQE